MGKMSAFRTLKSPAVQAFSSAILLWAIDSSSEAKNGVLNADISLQATKTKGAKIMKQIYALEQVEELIEQTRERAFLEGKEKGYEQGRSDGFQAGEDEALKRMERLEADED